MQSYEPLYYEFAKEQGSWSSFPRMQVLQFLRSILKDYSKVLEVGCGTAEILQFLPQDIVYTGIEHSAYACSKAQEKWRDIRPRSQFFSDSSSIIEIPEAQYDIVLLIFTLEHVEDPQKLLAECGRVLRKGGSMVILAPNLEFPLNWPSALRHKPALFRIWFTLMHCIDYLKRILGISTFRILRENFTEATGKYEKKDDDLRYLVSSWEVVKFLEGNNLSLIEFWEASGLSTLKKFMRHFPTLRWYGIILAAAFKKK